MQIDRNILNINREARARQSQTIWQLVVLCYPWKKTIFIHEKKFVKGASDNKMSRFDIGSDKNKINNHIKRQMKE